MKHVTEVLKNVVFPDSFSSSYSDPRWKERAKAYRKIAEGCNSCKRGGIQLYVHHVNYTPGVPIWEASDADLVCLCENCHALIHESIRTFRRVAARGNATSIAKISLALELMVQKYGELGTLIKLIEADEA